MDITNPEGVTGEVIEFPKREDERLWWECNCGSKLFYVSREGVECSQCEIWQVFP